VKNFLPDYLAIGPEHLGKGQPVKIRILKDMTALADDMARAMLDCIRQVRDEDRRPTLIVPVGPVDQFPVLARLVNEERLSLRDVLFINMDEYLTDDDEWIPREHPLSFRSFMDRQFYDLLDPALAPSVEYRVFPDPKDPGAVGRRLRGAAG
jgi:glucosamine-6-phosphate deaminase